MKSSIFNKREVPAVHPVCSLAETGRGEYDDFDNPLKPLDIISEGDKELVLKEELKPYGCDGYTEVNHLLDDKIVSPSQLCKKGLVTVAVPSGVHPITFLKENGIDVGIEKAWVFMKKDVVDVLRKMPYKFHQKSVAYGEIFRYENFDIISLQEVKYFLDWKVVLEGEINGKKFYRPDVPEIIIEVIIDD